MYVYRYSWFGVYEQNYSLISLAATKQGSAPDPGGADPVLYPPQEFEAPSIPSTFVVNTPGLAQGTEREPLISLDPYLVQPTPPGHRGQAWAEVVADGRVRLLGQIWVPNYEPWLPVLDFHDAIYLMPTDTAIANQEVRWLTEDSTPAFYRFGVQTGDDGRASILTLGDIGDDFDTNWHETVGHYARLLTDVPYTPLASWDELPGGPIEGAEKPGTMNAVSPGVSGTFEG